VWRVPDLLQGLEPRPFDYLGLDVGLPDLAPPDETVNGLEVLFPLAGINHSQLTKRLSHGGQGHLK
jgi:hypothetical protein